MRRRDFSIEYGSLNDEEMAALLLIAREAIYHGGPIIEIGTLFGRTAARIAEDVPQKTIVTVDRFSWNPWGIPADAQYAVARLLLDKYVRAGQVTIHRKAKEDFYRQYAGPAPS